MSGALRAGGTGTGASCVRLGLPHVLGRVAERLELRGREARVDVQLARLEEAGLELLGREGEAEQLARAEADAAQHLRSTSGAAMSVATRGAPNGLQRRTLRAERAERCAGIGGPCGGWLAAQHLGGDDELKVGAARHALRHELRDRLLPRVAPGLLLEVGLLRVEEDLGDGRVRELELRLAGLGVAVLAQQLEHRVHLLAAGAADAEEGHLAQHGERLLRAGAQRARRDLPPA